MTDSRSVLLQLRTYAAAGRSRVLCCIFVLLDISVIVALAILRPRRDGVWNIDHGLLGLHGYLESGTYDPYVWMTLVPLDATTLLANLYLGLKEYRCSKKGEYRMPKLMVIILRDNVLYLIL